MSSPTSGSWYTDAELNLIRAASRIVGQNAQRRRRETLRAQVLARSPELTPEEVEEQVSAIVRQQMRAIGSIGGQHNRGIKKGPRRKHIVRP